MGSIIGSLAIIGGYAALIIAIVFGYVTNIISLVTQSESVGMMVGRVVGVFVAPIGIVLGYF